MKQLEGFAKGTQGVAAGDSRLPAESFEYLVGARQGSGVTVRGARGGGGAPRFDDGDGLARGPRSSCGARKSFGILDAFQIQAECRYPRVLAKNFDEIFHREARLVAHGEQAADGQGAVVEHESQGNRTALANERHAAIDGRTHDLIRHHRDAVEEVHEAVTVRPEEGQSAGIAGELSSEPMAGLGARLGEARGETHEASGAARRKGGCHARRFVIRHGQEGRIGNARKIGN
jgi:hypothetical protein